MQKIERIPQIDSPREVDWRRYAVDTLLAVGGSFIITGIIYSFHLYPTIPNISIAYLLLILPLAITRGRYAALLAAVLTTLSFDFFLVPPLYTFTMYHWEEWLALIMFLVTALLTSQMAVLTKTRAEEARVQERETRILFELISLSNRQETLEDLLEVVALSIVRVFSSWGVTESAILLPDATGVLSVHADAPLRVEQFTLALDELERANWVMKHGKMMESRSVSARGEGQAAGDVKTEVLSLLPLKTGEQVQGVVVLRLRNAIPWFVEPGRSWEKQARPENRTAFFWTFLDQAASIIERVVLRSRVESGM